MELVQSALREGKLAEEATWQVVVLITKGEKDYRGIGLVEVMWKVVAAILNLRLTASITFHDFLHGFRKGRGTGTTTLKAKLLQQLAALREEVLYVIFLDLHKAYDALDRSRCLEIMFGLVEVMWKVVAAILNRRFTASIAYHDFLHWFWTPSRR